jgi:hypothetical protein
VIVSKISTFDGLWAPGKIPTTVLVDVCVLVGLIATNVVDSAVIENEMMASSSLVTSMVSRANDVRRLINHLVSFLW